MEHKHGDFFGTPLWLREAMRKPSMLGQVNN